MTENSYFKKRIQFYLAGLKIFKSILKNKIKPTPIMCQWLATFKCNYNCSFCNIRDNSPRKESTTKEVIDLIKIMSDMGVGIFYVAGGEPLLRNDLKPILASAKKSYMITMLSTNGYLIDKRLDILPFLDYIRVSLHSLKNYEKMVGIKNTKCLKKVLDNIELLKKYKINIAINMVVTEKNIDEMEEIAKLAEKLRIKVSFTKMMEQIIRVLPGKSKFKPPIVKQYLSEIRRLRKKYNSVFVDDYYLDFEGRGGFLNTGIECKAPDVLVSLNDGKIHLPCAMLPLKKIDPRHLKEKWRSKEFDKTREIIKHHESCKGCTDRCAFFPTSLLTLKGFINIVRGFK